MNLLSNFLFYSTPFQPIGGGHLDAGTTNSTGSSNSQDSFPAQPGGGPNTPIDGYQGYSGSGAYPSPAVPQPDYGAPGQMQRPPSQSNSQPPHPGKQATLLFKLIACKYVYKCYFFCSNLCPYIIHLSFV